MGDTESGEQVKKTIGTYVPAYRRTGVPARRHKTAQTLLIAALAIFFLSPEAYSYPEFYEYSKKISGRATNCALCHTHGDGPEGSESGQIGALNQKEMERLMRARAAFEPGQMINSPVLNEFGNAIIEKLGKKKFLSLKTRPQALPEELGKKLDIDMDGIPDAEEYLDGTLAVNREDGHPLKLFAANVKKNLFHIILAFFSIGFLFYGFVHWLKGIHLQVMLDELNKKGERNDQD